MQILLQTAVRPQPILIYSAYDLLKAQNHAFETLVISLRRLDSKHHRQFLVQTLTIALDLPRLNELPLDALVGLLFDLLEQTNEARSLLRLQNILIYVSQTLEAAA
jgi:hypothetical protein